MLSSLFLTLIRETGPLYSVCFDLTECFHKAVPSWRLVVQFGFQFYKSFECSNHLGCSMSFLIWTIAFRWAFIRSMSWATNSTRVILYVFALLIESNFWSFMVPKHAGRLSSAKGEWRYSSILFSFLLYRLQLDSLFSGSIGPWLRSIMFETDSSYISSG